MEEDCLMLRRLAEKYVGSKAKLNLQEATTEGLLLLLKLKEDSRALAFEAEEQRDETSKFKTRLEQAHLQLQNLLYEKEYYEKEIHECQSFRFKHSDSAIGLVPVEEFLQNASPEVIARIGDNQHTLMLERLKDELDQRKAMVAKLEELRKSKAATRQEVDKRKRTLDDLQQQLQGLEETAKPLQTILAPHLSLRGFQRNADLLPLPLYIIYSQFAAVREALGLPIRVVILGSAVEADSFAKALTVDPTEVTGDAGAAAVPADPSLSKKARVSPTPASGAVHASGSEDVYRVHPLSVLLEVQRDVNGRLQTFMSVKFQFLVNLKLVTAHCEVREDNVLLSALFPGDDGTATPFESLAQLQGGTFKYDTTRPAKPYRWCQHLAGLDFAPPLPLATQLPLGNAQPPPQQQQGAADGGGSGAPQNGTVTAVLEGLDVYRRQQRVIAVIERLRAVKAGDEALKKILASLDKAPNPPNLSRYPKLPLTVVASVEEIKTQTAAAAGQGGKAASGAAKGAAAAITPGRAGSVRVGDGRLSAAPNGRSGSQAAVERQGQGQPLSAVPARVRGGSVAAGATEEGEAGRRGSRPASPARDGSAAAPAADAATATGTEGGSARAGAAEGAGDAPATGASDGDAAMEDGEAVEEGEAGDEQQDEDHDLYDMDHDYAGTADGSDLLARYLLSDVPGADERGGPEARWAAPPSPKPVSRLYRLVLRHKTLEAEVMARLFLEYPVRPPLLLVRSIREAARDRRSAAKAVEDVNAVAWMEAEANSVALSQVPPDAPHATLLYQLLHLRLAFDEFATAHFAGASAVPPALPPASSSAAAAAAAAAAGGGEDLMALMAAKQRLRGRDRHPVLPVLAAAPTAAAGQPQP